MTPEDLWRCILTLEVLTTAVAIAVTAAFCGLLR